MNILRVKIQRLMVSAVVAAIMAGGVFSMKNITYEKLHEALILLAEAYQAPTPPPDKKEILAKAGELDRLIPGVPEQCQPILRYHQARLLIAGNDAVAAVKILDKLLEDKDLAMPEALWLHIQIWDAGEDDAASRRRWNLEDRLGSMLPISSWGALLDAHLAQREADRTGTPLFDADWPTVPIIDGIKLTAIAEEYAAMGMQREAAIAYREALYGGFFPPNLYGLAPRTWISEEASVYWLNAARLDAALGQTARAFQALCFVIAAEPAKLPEADTILVAAASAKHVPSRAVPDPKRLKKIASLYRSCNLHPLALEALGRAPKGQSLIELEQQQRDISKEWKQLLSSYLKGRRGTCFLFGHKLSEADPDQLLPKRFPY